MNFQQSLATIPDTRANISLSLSLSSFFLFLFSLFTRPTFRPIFLPRSLARSLPTLSLSFLSALSIFSFPFFFFLFLFAFFFSFRRGPRHELPSCLDAGYPEGRRRVDAHYACREHAYRPRYYRSRDPRRRDIHPAERGINEKGRSKENGRRRRK